MSEGNEAHDPTAGLADFQRQYWQFDAREKARLLESDPLDLPWPEMLRLNHLCCLEMLRTEAGQAQLQSEDGNVGNDDGNGDGADLWQGLQLEFWPDLLAKLASMDSPYRPRPCFLWHGEPGASETHEPDLVGLASNASLTHFGCLEIVRLDAQEQPTELAFVGLDELAGMVLGPAALFRVAKLFYDSNRDDEIVCLPLLYGVSWQCNSPPDRDGSLTRFVAHTEVRGLMESMGIGVGHQDLMIAAEENNQTLVGLGSIGEMMVALEVADPKFDEKCRHRGLDPEEVRRQVTGD